MTPIRLDDFTWRLLGEIAAREGVTVHKLCDGVDKAKPRRLSLSAALRLGVLQYYHDATTETGHIAAGHGTTQR